MTWINRTWQVIRRHAVLLTVGLVTGVVLTLGFQWSLEATSTESFVSAVAQEPSHPRMMPSNAEDRRDPRDAAGAGPARDAKRARATRHDAAAKSSGHGGMLPFLE